MQKSDSRTIPGFAKCFFKYILYSEKKKDKQTKTYTFWRLSDTEMKYITLAIVSFNSCFKGFPKLLCSKY